MTCFLYFTSQANLDSNQKINQNMIPQAPSSKNIFSLMPCEVCNKLVANFVRIETNYKKNTFHKIKENNKIL